MSRHFIIAESRYTYICQTTRRHNMSQERIVMRTRRSEVCLSSVAIVNESSPCLLRGTEFGFVKCSQIIPSICQIIKLFVGAMNPYRNRTLYQYVPFCQYPLELLNCSFCVCPSVKRWAAPTEPMLAAGSCVCFGQAFNLFYDPCLTLSGREQQVSSSIIRLA
jgi:hypothetical protein